MPTMAAVTTHDLPTVAGIWSGADLADLEAAGVTLPPDGDALFRHRLRVAAHCTDDAGLDQVAVEAHRAVASAPAMVATAALELGREADTERQTAQASAGAADDVTTPHVDERREGLNDAQPHVQHAAADQSTASALLDQADTSRATSAAGAPATATAAQSYPTPIKEVCAAQAAPKTAAAAPAARTAARKAPTASRRR